MPKDDRRDEGFLVGLVLGGLIGAGVALILGGEDKEKIRKSLKEKGAKLLKNLEEVVEEKKEKAEEVKEETEKKVEQLKSSRPVRRFFTRGGKKLS